MASLRTISVFAPQTAALRSRLLIQTDQDGVSMPLHSWSLNHLAPVGPRNKGTSSNSFTVHDERVGRPEGFSESLPHSMETGPMDSFNEEPGRLNAR